MLTSISSRCDICRCDAESDLGVTGCRALVITKNKRIRKEAGAAKMKLSF